MWTSRYTLQLTRWAFQTSTSQKRTIANPLHSLRSWFSSSATVLSSAKDARRSPTEAAASAKGRNDGVIANLSDEELFAPPKQIQRPRFPSRQAGTVKQCKTKSCTNQTMDFTYCESCRANLRARTRWRNAKQRAAGLCVYAPCQNKPEPGCSRCSFHRLRKLSNEKMRKKAVQRAESMSYLCGSPHV